MSAYENALRQRDRLLQELQQIDTFLKLHEHFSADGVKAERVAVLTPKAIPMESVPADLSARIVPRRNLPKEKMAVVVRGMIDEMRRPMTRTDIVDGLELKGIPVAGNDKAKAIGTIMWRLRDEFVNLTGFGYWPIEMPFPQAAYVPGGELSPVSDNTDMFNSDAADSSEVASPDEH